MSTVSPDVRIAPDRQALMRAAAEAFVDAANEAVRVRGLCAVALAGGSTPKGLYTSLATDPFRARVPWMRVHFFWGDERHVPPDHPDSNYRMVHEAMLSRVEVPADHVHRIKAERSDAAAAAEEYDSTLREFAGQGAPARGGVERPLFDLVLLGMGPDGHTASLFPGTDAVGEKARLVVANWVDTFKAHRITLTVPALSNAARVVFLVSGEDKAEMLRAVLQDTAARFPASLIRPKTGRPTWLVDKTAARLIGGGGVSPNVTSSSRRE
jgi:6-phosphogluconolactonase